MTRRILAGAALATCLLGLGAHAAMAADWRYVASGSRDYVDAECAQGKRFGAWSECDIRKRGDGTGWDLYVR